MTPMASAMQAPLITPTKEEWNYEREVDPSRCQSCGGCLACECRCICEMCRCSGAVMGDRGLCLACEPIAEDEERRWHESEHGPGRF